MLNLIQNQILFYLALVILLFLPGYFFLLAVWGKNNRIMSEFEKFVVSFGLSIVLVDFIMMILGKFFSITRVSLLASLIVFILACYAIYKYRFKNQTETQEEIKEYNFSKNQIISIFLILFLSIFIRTLYLDRAVLPSATDLGHHMFWAKYISETGKIPKYDSRNIVEVNGSYQISSPQNISDFIIGEHLIFSAINLITGIDFISYFPVITLLLIDLMSLFALFILAFRMFTDPEKGKRVAILTLLFIGPIFAISPPQAKYIGGGVIGNIIGDLMMPLIFYFYIRFLKERDKWFLTLALLFSMGLFYIHHLTGFMFLLTMAIFVPLYLILNFKDFSVLAKTSKKIVLSWPVIVFAVFAVVFLLTVYIPSYLTNNAVNTVVGTINKQDHTGLTIDQLKDTVGEARLALGILGIIMIFFFTRSMEKNSRFVLVAWLFVVFFIALYPGAIKINLPSGRDGNYATYPLALLSGYAVMEIFSLFKTKDKNLRRSAGKFVLPVLILVFAYFFINGLDDNTQNLAALPDPAKAMDTFHASAYLASLTSATDNVLADHVYIAADSWIKTFFMRDYNFPFYRANPDRYTNGVDKNEMCTYWMISSPESASSQKCFHDLGIDYVMVNGATDGPQFERTDGFSKIYSGNFINIYSRN